MIFTAQRYHITLSKELVQLVAVILLQRRHCQVTSNTSTIKEKNILSNAKRKNDAKNRCYKVLRIFEWPKFKTAEDAE